MIYAGLSAVRNLIVVQPTPGRRRRALSFFPLCFLFHQSLLLLAAAVLPLLLEQVDDIEHEETDDPEDKPYYDNDSNRVACTSSGGVSIQSPGNRERMLERLLSHSLFLPKSAEVARYTAQVSLHWDQLTVPAPWLSTDRRMWSNSPIDRPCRIPATFLCAGVHTGHVGWGILKVDR